MSQKRIACGARLLSTLNGMSYAATVCIHLCNLALAFYASALAVTGDGGGVGVYMVQIISSAVIGLAAVGALLLCRARRPALAVKLSLLTLPALFLAALLFLAAMTASHALLCAMAILLFGWAVVVTQAKRRISKISPVSLGSVILSSKFTGFEWAKLLVVAAIASVTWYQLLKATVQ